MKTVIIATLLLSLWGCQSQNTATSSKDTTDPTLSAKACSKDLKVCADGRSVSRDPLNHCEFHSCESAAASKDEPMVCTQDVKQCADGSFVGRDSNKKCAFKPCPNGDGPALY